MKFSQHLQIRISFYLQWLNVKIWTILSQNIFCLSLLTFPIVAHFFIFNFGNGEENHFFGWTHRKFTKIFKMHCKVGIGLFDTNVLKDYFFTPNLFFGFDK